ncbi:MAG TPA: DUF881 domain-containing protein [Pantanalinema sp.]
MKNNWQLPVALVSVVMGFLLSTQIKNQRDYREAPPSRRAEDLVVMLRNAESAKADLEKELKGLRAEREGVGPSPRAAAGELAAGMVALEGQGLEVSVSDSAKPLQKGEDPNIAIVHNDDLLRLVNELRAGGAEAVSINDQRLVDTSEITCAGSTILVNQSRITPPFVIKAIGNPDTMSAALGLRGGIIEYLQFYGIQVSISKKSEVLIPMYSGGSHYRYAKPVPAREVQS